MSLSGHEEGECIAHLWKTTLNVNELWAVVDAKWFQTWQFYTGFNYMTGQIGVQTGAKPGPIDNSRLASEENPVEIRRDLEENRDYIIMHKDVWDKLDEWYGGAPVFVRKVIVVGLQQRTRLDMYPMYLRIYKSSQETGEPIADSLYVIELSRRLTFKDLIKKIVNDSRHEHDSKNHDHDHYDDDDDDDDFKDEVDNKIRLWMQDRNDMNRWSLLEGDDLTIPIDNFQFPSNTTLLVEKCKADGSWIRVKQTKDWRDFAINDIIDARDTVSKWYESTIRDIKGTRLYVHYNGWPQNWDEWIDTQTQSDRLAPRGTYSAGTRVMPSGRFGQGNEEGRPEEKGVVGLSNLGNTCFMNSTLQCLSNTPILTEYFVDDQYLAELNRTNPLGWQGRVAEEYGTLLKELWSGKYRTVTPVKFKQVLGEFAPRFSGYQQQDSSELLNFLLDGLHEDLNLIKSKPATQPVEAKGRSDHVVAAESWHSYEMRNTSIITKTLVGQLKSTVVCPQCSRISITFDPFMFLSVPMPIQQTKNQLIAFVSAQSNVPPTLYALKVKKSGAISQISEQLQQLAGVNPKSLIIADVYNSRVSRIFEDHQSIEDIDANDFVYVYEVPDLDRRVASRKAKTKTVSFPAHNISLMDWGEGLSSNMHDDDDDDDVNDNNNNTTGNNNNINNHDDGEDGEATGSATGETGAAGADTETGATDAENSNPSQSNKKNNAAESEAKGDATLLIQLVQQQAQPSPYSSGLYISSVSNPVFFALPLSTPLAQVHQFVAEKIAAFTKSSISDVQQYTVHMLDDNARTCLKCDFSCDGCALPQEGTLADIRAIANKAGFSMYRADCDLVIAVRWLQSINRIDPLQWKHLNRHQSLLDLQEQAQQRKAQLQLTDCLRLFNQEEKLGADNAWYCSVCKEHQQAMKKFDIWKLPPVLIIHLKRFSYSKYAHDKINDFVDFPIRGLDMSAYCVNEEEKKKGALYDLYAVSNHYGVMGGGHYTAYCKNLINNKWYNMDDSSTNRVDEKSIKTPAAYVLYYVRRAPGAAEPPQDDYVSIDEEADAKQQHQQTQSSHDNDNDDDDDDDNDDDNDDIDSDVARVDSPARVDRNGEGDAGEATESDDEHVVDNQRQQTQQDDDAPGSH